jgi:hypothetical protein
MITILHKPESLFQSTENALTEALTAPKEEQARARPVFSLYVSDGESVDFSPIRVCLIPYTRRLGKRSPHRGKRCLVEAAALPSGLRIAYQHAGHIKSGFRIDCCQPFVLRALAKSSGTWCAYPEEDVALAVVARGQLRTLVERVAREYERQRTLKLPQGQERPPHAVLLERATRQVWHSCGYSLLLHTLYTRRLSRHAGGAALHLYHHGFAVSLPQHRALSHCPKCRVPLALADVGFRAGA